MREGIAGALLGVAVFFGAGVAPVSAQEVRILDGAGLVRAVRPTANPVRVEIEIVGGEASRLAGATLVQTTGLAEDRTAAVEGRGYRFDGIPPGTWQINLREASEQVTAVRITVPGARLEGN